MEKLGNCRVFYFSMNIFIFIPYRFIRNYFKRNYFMKKVLFLLFTFLSITSLIPQSDDTKDTTTSFKAGEWFKFRIHYGFLNASYATISLKEDTLNGKKVYHAIGHGKTTGLASLFFKVNDNYESYFDKKTGQPYRFIRKIDEGGHIRDQEINFDYETNKAILTDHKRKKQHVFEINNQIQDIISAFYFLRQQCDVKTIKPGDEFVSDMIFDDDGVYNFKMKFLERETIRTKFGKLETLKFRPYVQSGRVFKENESLTLWVTADENKLPIKVKADIFVGAISADLEAFNGLKHSFDTQIDDE